jgi:hypothetical protein
MHVYSLQFEFGCDFGGVDKGNDGNSPSLFSTQKHSAQVQHVLGNGEFQHIALAMNLVSQQKHFS